jgi:hypothetical protein
LALLRRLRTLRRQARQRKSETNHHNRGCQSRPPCISIRNHGPLDPSHAETASP